jgi:hypothetical protein
MFGIKLKTSLGSTLFIILSCFVLIVAQFTIVGSSYSFSPINNVAPVVTGIQGSQLTNINSPLSFTGSQLGFLGAYFKAEGADFNKDGFGDILMTGNGTGNINSYQPGNVKINNGNGTFTNISLSSDTRDGLTGDFNNDGNLDIVFSASLGATGITLFLGNGAGGFVLDSTTGLSGNGDVEKGDFNNDGNLDLYMSNESGSGSIWSNNGSADFIQTVISSNLNARYSTIGDYNSDGNLDIISSNPTQTLLFTGNGALGFTQYPTQVSFGNMFDLGNGDFNNDGKLDVYISVFNFPDQLKLGNGDGTFTDSVIFDNTFGSWTNTVVDYDNDGDQDVFRTGNIRRNSLLINDGSGNFTKDPLFEIRPFTWETEIFDINKDGVLDVIQLHSTTNGNNLFLSNTKTSAQISESNQTTVGNALGYDKNINDTFSYSISGGEDAGDFNVNQNTGVLNFIQNPDFEIPRDQNNDNLYKVKVLTTDQGNLKSERLFEVSVLDGPELENYNYYITSDLIYETGDYNYRKVDVQLTANPTNGVVVKAELSGSTKLRMCDSAYFINNQCNQSAASLDLQFSTGTTVKSFYVFAVDNFIDEEDIVDAQIAFDTIDNLSDIPWDNLEPKILPLYAIDDDVTGFSVSAYTDTIVNEGDNYENINVVLNSQPLFDIKVIITHLNPDLTTSIRELIFTPQNWNIPQAVTIETLIDNNNEENRASIEFRTEATNILDSGYSELEPQVVSLTIIDLQNDTDNDGIDDLKEAEIFNQGDGNFDGEIDNNQSDVTSFELKNNEYITIDANGCGLSEITKMEEENLDLQDQEYDYPLGLISFLVDCGSATITLYSKTNNETLRKFVSSYSTIELTSTEVRTTQNGENIKAYTYEITDGGELDSGVAGDNKIIDPIGFGVQVNNENPPSEFGPQPTPSPSITTPKLPAETRLIRTGGV